MSHWIPACAGMTPEGRRRLREEDRGKRKWQAVAKILPFEKALHAHFANNYGDLVKKINDTADWNNDIEAQFKKGVEEFKKTGSW